MKYNLLFHNNDNRHKKHLPNLLKHKWYICMNVHMYVHIYILCTQKIDNLLIIIHLRNNNLWMVM